MLEKNAYKVACDRGSCKNIAAYAIRAKGFGRGAKFYLCEDCLHMLYDEVRKMTTPKSPKNVIAKGLKKEAAIGE
jgi:hypothetical protein